MTAENRFLLREDDMTDERFNEAAADDRGKPSTAPLCARCLAMLQ